MVLDKKITLLVLEAGKGSSMQPVETARKIVWAKRETVGVKTKLQALVADTELSMVVVIYRRAYDGLGYTHCMVDDVVYKIVSASQQGNSQYLRLFLSRG